MVIGIKDLSKLFAITVVSCCAVFVCALFLHYNLDIVEMKDAVTSPQAMVMYEAQVATGKVVAGVSGGCLAATTLVMLIFYVKNYIDSHGKELGILKALGYSRLRVAKHFWVFGISVGLGAVLGYTGAAVYMPTFYRVQNNLELLPDMSPQPQPVLALCLLALPTAFFMLLAVLYAFCTLKRPALLLLREMEQATAKPGKSKSNDLPFLRDLRKTTLGSRKILVFFAGFSAFCFSAMTQMSMSMDELASESFSWMILSIGLILAFMTLWMSMTSVIKGNAKTIAMMKVFGYSQGETSRAILGGYRPVSYVGFVLGTVYQYVLLRIMVDVVFADYPDMPEFHFGWKAFFLSLGMFAVTYEIILRLYGEIIRKMPVKSIMLE